MKFLRRPQYADAEKRKVKNGEKLQRPCPAESEGDGTEFESRILGLGLDEYGIITRVRYWKSDRDRHEYAENGDRFEMEIFKKRAAKSERRSKGKRGGEWRAAASPAEWLG